MRILALLIMVLFSGPVAAKDQWPDAIGQISVERAALAACRATTSCPPVAKRFQGLVDSVKGLTGLALLGQLNRAVNGAIWPQTETVDEWSSPFTTLGRGYGDCEDYALTKLMALLEVGISPDSIRFVLLRRGREDHAVLFVRVDGQWRVLNNQTLILETEAQLYSHGYLVFDSYSIGKD